jgi:hypothetical protein
MIYAFLLLTNERLSKYPRLLISLHLNVFSYEAAVSFYRITCNRFIRSNSRSKLLLQKRFEMLISARKFHVDSSSISRLSPNLIARTSSAIFSLRASMFSLNHLRKGNYQEVIALVFFCIYKIFHLAIVSVILAKCKSQNAV